MSTTDAFDGSTDDGRAVRGLLSRYRYPVRVGLMVGAAIADIGVIALACYLGSVLRYGNASDGNWQELFFLLAPTSLLAALALRAYRLPTLSSLSRSIATAYGALLIAGGIALSAAFALKVGSLLSRLETAYVLLLALLFLGLIRLCGLYLIHRLLRALFQPRVIVFTDGMHSELRARNRLAKILDIRKAELVPNVRDPRFFDEVSRTVRFVDRVILEFSDVEERGRWVEAMRLSGLDAEIVVEMPGIKPLALSHWSGYTTLVISRGPLTLSERLAKRAFDIVVASALLIVTGPAIAVAALLVRLDSPGPVFFVQQRVGRNNRSYPCFKLRTMRADTADATGHVSTARDDVRITRVGHFLRRSSIDELPQLVNVLIGTMSLVGPRPHALGSRAEGALFWELVPDYWSRHSVKPGMTGLAQIRGLRGATHSRSDIEGRVAADLEYINNWSLWLDMKILVRTVGVAIHHNAH